MRTSLRFRHWTAIHSRGHMRDNLTVGDTIEHEGCSYQVTTQDLKDYKAKRKYRLMLASGVLDQQGQELYEADVVQVFQRGDSRGVSYFAYVVWDPTRGFLYRNAQDLPLTVDCITRVWTNFYAQPHWVEQFGYHQNFIREHWF
ncbi:hypothetical protein [uncultured Hymenobacter sp.]|uniref:hypothetical protein n=1 Tax=uncultured Hymenobacter sp. TaxID=170016 RepID=UPI0035CAC023